MSAPPPPPPPTFNIANAAGGDQGRGLLLQSIRAGKSLKKTVTVDKSAPCINGKINKNYHRLFYNCTSVFFFFFFYVK